MAEGTAPQSGAEKKESVLGEFGDIVKSYIFPIIAVVGLGLITYFVYVPSVTRLPEMIDQQKTLDKNIETLDANLAKLDELNQLPLDMMSSTLDELIPTEAKVAELVESLTGLAGQAGLQITIPEDDTRGRTDEEAIIEDIVAGEVDSGPEYQISRVPVTLSFIGTRTQVEAFLDLIQSSDRVLSIQEASMRASEGVWQVELVISGYKGEIVVTSLPDSTRIDAESDNVLSTIRPITTDLTTQEFYSATSQYSN